MTVRRLTLAAAAVAAAAVASPALAQPAGAQTITFRELNKGSRFAYVDNPPLNNPHRRPVFSVGDEIVIANPLADAKGREGELRARCTVTHNAPANDTGLAKGHPLCVGAFILRGGTLFVETVDAGGKVTRGVVTDGTGAYANARGTFTSTTTRTGNDDVATLLS